MRTTLARTIRARLDALLGGAWGDKPLAVALSGGADSVALAWACSSLCREQGIPLHCFHVHHGLMADADRWAAGIISLARALGATPYIAQVKVDAASGEGIEAAARQARYEALSELARAQGVSAVLLAHHQDDQVETVLFRLFRGTGLAGMAGIPESKTQSGVHFVRPLLSTPRSVLTALAGECAAATGTQIAQDPSNQDPGYARAYLREAVVPAIAGYWPGYRQTLLRFSRHCIDAEAELEALTDEDHRFCLAGAQGERLSVSALSGLSPYRALRVLRRWLKTHDVMAPTEQRLRQWHRQLTEAGPDRQLELRHDGWVIHRYRDEVCLVEVAARPEAQTFRWRGEEHLAFPGFGGSLRIEPAEEGIDPAWLQEQVLTLDRRRGGERLRLHPKRPARTLKNLYQEAGVPPWDRETLPLLRSATGLLFVAGCGQSVDCPQSRPGLRLHWSVDPRFLA